MRRVVCGVLLLLLPVAAFAQSDAPEQMTIVPHPATEVRGDFLVGPTRFTLEMNPGDERRIEIQLTSREGQLRDYEIGVEDFSVGDDGISDVRLYGREDGPFPARSWVQIPATSVQLLHGESAMIPVTISVPENAEPGDHYAVVLFERQGEGFGADSRVGALLLITVNGELVREGQSGKFSVARRVFRTLPVEFSVQYRNIGSVHLVPAGHIVIRNILGLPVDDLPVHDWYVLRNSLRERAFVWQPTFALGRYTATLTLNSAGQTSEQVSTISFWVVPVRSILIIVVGMIAAFFLFQWFLTALRRR